MKFNFLFLVSFSLIITSCGKDDETVSSTFDVLISRTLFNQDEIKLYDFVITDDQSIVVVFNGINPSDYDDDFIIDSTFIHLQKINNIGESQWIKGFPSANTRKATDIIQTMDDGFLILGNAKPNKPGADQKTLVLKTDNDGIELWSKIIETDGAGEGHEMVERENSNIVILANRVLKELTEIAQNGNQLSTVRVPIEQWPSLGRQSGLCLGNHSKIILAGSGMMAYQGTSPIWEFKYDINDEPYGKGLLSVSPVEDDGYLAFGFQIDNQVLNAFDNIDYLLTRVDESGIILWEKTFDNENQDWGYDINPTPDGNFVAIGKSNKTGPDVGGFIRAYKFDPQGNILWQHKMEDLNAEFIEPCSIKQIDDEHVVVMYVEMRLRDPQILTEVRLAKIKME